MRRAAFPAAIGAFLLSVFLSIFFTQGADAVSHGKAPPFAMSCPIYDTTVLSKRASSAISDCKAFIGNYRTLFVTATGQLSCELGAPPGFAVGFGLWAVGTANPQPPLGANFIGSISSGVLTVTSMITPSRFIIENGELLSDGQSGVGIPNTGPNGSNTTIQNQLTSTEPDGSLGHRGTYSLFNGSFSVGSESIWALNNYNQTPTGGAGVSAVLLEQSSCNVTGKTYPMHFSGALKPQTFIRPYVWIGLSFESEFAPASSNWRQGQITVWSPS